MRRLPPVIRGLVAVLFFPATAAADEPLSRAEVGRLGKAATALVEVRTAGGVSHGSAFCVHPSGLFLTNEHVVRRAGDGGAVTVILNPAQKTQRVAAARLVRADRDLDLALLRLDADAGGKLPVLALGADDGLSELDEVIAFGFPFGAGLALEKDQYPAISVNVGSVTSLRRRSGELHRIQLDAALNPGNSGGPVVDRGGRVVGVVVSGVPGSGVNQAIPVSHAARFLSRPDLQLTMPAVAAADRSKPAVFQAKAAALLPGSKPLTLELILKPDGGPERRLPMTPTGDVYRATAVPVPAADGAAVLRLDVRYPAGSLTGAATDRAFRAGDREVKLSAVHRIRLLPTAAVELRDGTMLPGPVTALGLVGVDVGGDTITVNLGRAAEIQIDPPAEVTAVACTVVVTQDGKEVGRVSETLTFRSTATAPAAPGSRPAATAFRPPVLAEDRVVRDLPGPYERVCVGGSGRYLFFHLAAQRRIAVFDVSAAQVVKYLPAAEEKVFIAAGQDHLFVVLPAAGVVQRWNLATLERDVSSPLAAQMNINGAYMGSASDGPLVINAQGGAVFLDPRTLKSLDVTVEGREGRRDPVGLNEGVRVSANGQVFGSWAFGVSPAGLRVFVLTGKTVKLHYQHDSVGHIAPSPDGRTIHTAIGRFTQNLVPIGSLDGGRGYGSRGVSWCVPAVQGNELYLNVVQAEHRGDKKPGPLVSVHWAGDGRKLVDLPAIALKEISGWGRDAIGDDQRLLLMPAANVLVELPKGNGQVVLHRFDLDALLEKSGADYLLVTSSPPTAAARGQTLSYQLTVKSKKGGVKYRLDAAPPGMTISADGRLTWAVPADWGTRENDVIITVADAAGQEVFHTFKIGVGE